MRVLVVVIAIAAACDLKPAPKQAPAPPAPSGPAAVAAPPTPALPPDDAGVADAAPPPIDAMEVSDQCVRLGTHIAEVLLAEADDPAKRAVLVQDRAKIVRRTAESCTRDAWAEEQIRCYLGAKTQIAMQACARPAAPPAPPPNRPGAVPQ